MKGPCLPPLRTAERLSRPGRSQRPAGAAQTTALACPPAREGVLPLQSIPAYDATYYSGHCDKFAADASRF